MQSLCALAHFDFNQAGAYSYEQALLTIRQLKLPMESRARRLVGLVLEGFKEVRIKLLKAGADHEVLDRLIAEFKRRSPSAGEIRPGATVEEVVQWSAGVVLPPAGSVSVERSGQVGRHLAADLDVVVVFVVLRFADAEAAQFYVAHRGHPVHRRGALDDVQRAQVFTQRRKVRHVEHRWSGRRADHRRSRRQNSS
jgi:hypothetical protein